MAKRGPKPIEIDWEQFNKLCALQCTLKEIALWFECSIDTIEDRCVSVHGMKFSEYYAQKAEKGRISLRRKMWELALKGDKTMLIWLSKQYLSMTEKVEQRQNSNAVVKVDVSDIIIPSMSKEQAQDYLERLKQKESLNGKSTNGEGNEKSGQSNGYVQSGQAPSPVVQSEGS